MYAQLLLILGLFGTLHAESVVSDSSKPCTWGPSYWCTSVKSAKDCGAVQFCIRNTWRQPSFVEGIHDDDTCAFCKKMVTDIRDYVTADQTEQAIIAFADHACTMLPDKFMQDECKGIANLYIVQIISMLKQNMDPTAVCRVINLCVTADMFISPANYRQHFAVSQAAITHMAVDKLKMARVGDVFKTLAENTAKHSDSLPSTQLRAFVGSAFDQCDTCKQGVEDLKIVFSNVQVRDEITQILKTQICPRFVLPAECKKLIDEYAPEIFQVIVNLDPTAACETIGLCQVADTPVAKKRAVMPMANIKPANRPVRTVETKTSVQCVLCEYVISMVVQALEDNKTDQRIIEAIEHVCDVMPPTVKPQCHQFIETYGEELIDLLTHSADPQSVCSILGLCSVGQDLEMEPPTKNGLSLDDVDLSKAIEAFTNIGPVLNAFADNTYDTKPSKDGDKERRLPLPFDIDPENACFMCRIVANYLITLIKENYTANAVQMALDKVCGFLPEKFRDQCQNFVHDYTAQIILSIVSSMNTQTICQSIQLCKASADYFPTKAERENIEVAPFPY